MLVLLKDRKQRSDWRGVGGNIGTKGYGCQ
jgi:hypothetical protein